MIGLVLGLILIMLLSGCATAPNGVQRGVLHVVNQSDTVSTTVTNGVTNIVSISNASKQGFIKPHLSLWGLIFGDSPTPTAIPSEQSVKEGQSAPQITVVESPYPQNPYGLHGGYGGGYGYPSYPYTRIYYNGGGYRTLFGHRYRSNN
jgi:hypothetical protein